MTFNDAELSAGLGPEIQLVRDEKDGPADSLEGDGARRRRILLVEDEQPFRELLQAFLESQGYDVQALRDGRCAAQWLETNTVDVVVTDLCMPEVDGMELLMTIRKMEFSTPVIAMSGGVSGQMVGMLRAAGLLGARHTLEKPFSLLQLATAVRETLAAR